MITTGRKIHNGSKIREQRYPQRKDERNRQQRCQMVLNLRHSRKHNLFSILLYPSPVLTKQFWNRQGTQETTTRNSEIDEEEFRTILEETSTFLELTKTQRREMAGFAKEVLNGNSNPNPRMRRHLTNLTISKGNLFIFEQKEWKVRNSADLKAWQTEMRKCLMKNSWKVKTAGNIENNSENPYLILGQHPTTSSMQFGCLTHKLTTCSVVPYCKTLWSENIQLK